MNQSLEQRVVNLEKNLRFYRIAVFGLLAIGCSFIFMSFNGFKTTADIVEAKAFHVIDNNGKVLVDISSTNGNGQLNTYNQNGVKLVSILNSDGGAGAINTFNKNGELLFKLTNTTSGGGYMALFNSQQKEIAELGVTNIESGYLKLNDRNSNRMIWMTYTQDGGGYLSLAKDGLEMMRFSTPVAGGRLGIYNNLNTRVAYLGVQDTKDGNLTLWNSQGVRSGGLP